MLDRYVDKWPTLRSLRPNPFSTAYLCSCFHFANLRWLASRMRSSLEVVVMARWKTVQFCKHFSCHSCTGVRLAVVSDCSQLFVAWVHSTNKWIFASKSAPHIIPISSSSFSSCPSLPWPLILTLLRRARHRSSVVEGSFDRYSYWYRASWSRKAWWHLNMQYISCCAAKRQAAYGMRSPRISSWSM